MGCAFAIRSAGQGAVAAGFALVTMLHFRDAIRAAKADATPPTEPTHTRDIQVSTIFGPNSAQAPKEKP